MGRYRKEKVEERIKEILSVMFLMHVKDPELKSVYVTHVKVSNDLKFAKIYYRIQSLESEKSIVEERIERARGFIKSHLGRELGIKYTPDVRFFFDDSIEQYERIEEILREIHKQNQ